MWAKKRGFGSVVSWVSLIGITLGVATLIVVMSVMGGFHETLLSRIIGMNGHVVVYHQNGAISDYDFLIDKILEPLPSEHAIKNNPKDINQYDRPFFLFVRAKKKM